MAYSIVLARFLGIFMTVIGLALLLNRAQFKKIIDAVIHNAGLQFMAALMPILIGSAIVATHNVWSNNWTIIITILGWMMILAGIFRSWFTEHWLKLARKVGKKDNIFWVGGIFWTILGLIMLYFGFVVG
ncbi:hypothetical protein JYT19_00080 [Sulfobacillus acidophilus]|uniref:DUF3397 domain-containing protein n=1 Tax=Sulfobacillus acidophilus TaxID=53633 RepID=A0ABS3AV87_9FIRM|nr:hypothetical protein [Sulfobacillus acidophilus]